MWIRLEGMYILIDFIGIFEFLYALFICIETAKIILNRLYLLNYYCHLESSALMAHFRRNFALSCGITDIFNLSVHGYLHKDFFKPICAKLKAVK